MWWNSIWKSMTGPAKGWNTNWCVFVYVCVLFAEQAFVSLSTAHHKHRVWTFISRMPPSPAAHACRLQGVHISITPTELQAVHLHPAFHYLPFKGCDWAAASFIFEVKQFPASCVFWLITFICCFTIMDNNFFTHWTCPWDCCTPEKKVIFRILSHTWIQ